MAPRRHSLRHRLPAGIALIVAVAVTLFGALAYAAARRATENAAWVRLQSVADRFAQITRASLASRREMVSALSRDPRIVTFLSTGSGADAARQALARLGPDTGMSVAVGLRNVAGERVLELNRVLPPLRSEALDISDSARITELFVREGVVEYEFISPVRLRERILGHVAFRRRIRSTPTTVNTLRGLMGSRAVLLIGNSDGSLWSDLIRPVERPELRGGTQTIEREGKPWLVATMPVPESPFVIAVELPRALVLAPLGALLWIFGSLAAAVVTAGAVAGWFLSRSVTDPLIRLTASAEMIAAGQQTSEHPVAQRHDEVGRLDHAFGIMARSVEESRERLELQVSERTRELEAAQHELVRSGKMAVLGQLASSVGHELRNPLGVMSNIAYYLTTTLPDLPPKAQNHLAMLKRQIVLTEKIVSDILDFTRVKPPESRDIAVAPFIEEQLQRVTFPATVLVERDIADDLPLVHADPVQIGQVMYNVLVNAVQAMESRGGRLTIRGVRCNGSVRIEVSDEGPGIPPEIRERIFEPLFTTRQRGIGLGLSVSRSLARANGGDLSVADRGAPGALFCLDLPQTRTRE